MDRLLEVVLNRLPAAEGTEAVRTVVVRTGVVRTATAASAISTTTRVSHRTGIAVVVAVTGR